ncbi:MAB_1171c family putative transporter [Streptomyces sp. Tue6028]|uniref:MAB_1171c family putative transporter n=1 Tax=Streptomyces sp. Tue6028 TaxID=2036037 RepID=UPI003D7120C8
MSGLIYYIAAAILWTGFAVQVPDLWRHRRDPLKRTLCAVVFLSGACFALGAPPTVALINRVSGITNAAAPLTYSVVNAFSAASLILIMYWRGGSPDRVRRIVHGWMIAYAAVICGQGVLFALGDTPVERRMDFDTFYASTPYIREMIILYLLAHMVAAFTTTILCWRWTRQVTGWTRTSMVMLAAGWLFTCTYSVVKIAALLARWTGRNWDTLSTSIAPLLVALGASLVSAGYILPLTGSRIDSLVALVRLRPLFRLLAGPGSSRYAVPIPWSAVGNVELQLTTRTTAIREGLKHLSNSGSLNGDVRSNAYRQALATGASVEEADAIGIAAMIAVAADTHASHSLSPTVFRLKDIPSDALEASGVGQRGLSVDMAQSSLVRFSRAVRTSIVHAAVQAQRTALQQP